MKVENDDMIESAFIRYAVLFITVQSIYIHKQH